MTAMLWVHLRGADALELLGDLVMDPTELRNKGVLLTHIHTHTHTHTRTHTHAHTPTCQLLPPYLSTYIPTLC